MSSILATITLEDGRIINLKLDEAQAPKSVENFIELANSNFYQGLIFHRVIKNFMIQGGGMDEKMDTKRAKSIKGEFISNGVNNTLTHKAGTISMARTMINDSASSQFFICSVAAPHLDGSYAAFGDVADAESMQVVLDISKVSTGNVGGYSDVPKSPIIIKSISVTK